MKKLLSIVLSITILLSIGSISAYAIDIPNGFAISNTEGADKNSVVGNVIGYIGDVNSSDTINVKDATAIQKHLASIIELPDDSLTLADADMSGKINVRDATAIQKWLANIDIEAPINHLLYIPDTLDVHTHSYAEKIVEPTCFEKGYTIYTCSCGDSYKDDWTNTYEHHNFENYECTVCGITPFDYYIDWIKENGSFDENHYEFKYPNITDIAGLENTQIEVLYYPPRDTSDEYIALTCYDFDTEIYTWIDLFCNDAEAYCMSGNDTYFDISTYIDITTFTTNTSIVPDKYEGGSYTYSSALECAQTEIALTILMHDRSMYDAGVGVSVVDLGFYSIYSDDNNPTPPVEDNVNPPVNNDNTYLDPILNCNDFPLHLYSNDGKVYLGKLVTNKYDSDSIWNEYGEYGSKYRTNSIWNEYGTYGSKYNTNSAFNPYASSPPIIVTNSGTKIGYLTANEYKLNGYTITELERLLKSIGQ